MTDRRRATWLLGGAIFALSLGVNMHVAMNVNFIHELLHGTSWQQGYLEAIRETCGILSFFVIMALVGRSEPKVAAVMLLLVGTGLAAYSRIATIPHLILCSLIWSFGFHVWVPISGSLALALARRGREGRLLGTLGSVGAAGVLMGLALVWALRRFAGFGMRELFLGGGALTALGAIPLLFLPDVRERRADVPRLTSFLAPKFRLYAAFELLDGMRKQIFILFATLALVQEHGARVETIAALMFANQIIMLGLAPLVGRWVDRVGSRTALVAYFTGLIGVFILYTALRDVRVLYGVFMVDSALWSLRVGLSTYAKGLTGATERTRLLAMGVTMNHVGAVTLPLAGGALYALYGYRLPFY
ncbi:MAG: MFS transporter, partial [bacterium]